MPGDSKSTRPVVQRMHHIYKHCIYNSKKFYYKFTHSEIKISNKIEREDREERKHLLSHNQIVLKRIFSIKSLKFKVQFNHHHHRHHASGKCVYS
jgi:hypothetical protein